jgi:RNA polymerase sigma factor (sigma-70 family)
MKKKFLSKEEEKILIIAARNGNKIARDKLIISNLGCIYNVALKYKNGPIPVEDLVNEGVFGIVHAIETFDFGKNTRFITHATWWIRNSISDANRRNGSLVRLPWNQQQMIKKELKKTIDGTNVSPEIKELMKIKNQGLSFDTPLNNNSTLKLADTIMDKNTILPDSYTDSKQVNDVLSKVLSCLNQKETDIICHLFGINNYNVLNTSALSDNLGVSKSRIKQYSSQALGKMKRFMMERQMNLETV